MKKLKVIVEASKDGYGVFTETEMFSGFGDSVEAAIENMKEGMAFYRDVMKEDGKPYPEWLDGEYEFELHYDMQSIVAHYAAIVGFAGLEKITGIHQKQLGAYAKGESKPRKEQTRRFIDGLHSFGAELSAIY